MEVKVSKLEPVYPQVTHEILKIITFTFIFPNQSSSFIVKQPSLMGSKIFQDKRSAKHLIRMIRKDRGFSSRISPYFPSYLHQDSSRQANDLSIQRWSENINAPQYSNFETFYGNEDFQNYLTRKWIKLLGLSMYYKNE